MVITDVKLYWCASCSSRCSIHLLFTGILRQHSCMSSRWICGRGVLLLLAMPSGRGGAVPSCNWYSDDSPLVPWEKQRTHWACTTVCTHTTRWWGCTSGFSPVKPSILFLAFPCSPFDCMCKRKSINESATTLEVSSRQRGQWPRTASVRLSGAFVIS